MVTNLQELVEAVTPTDISAQEILDLRAGLSRDLEEALSGWDRPEGPLRITKDRLRRSQTCTAQLLGGGDALLNESIALGRVVDVAASVMAVTPHAPHERIKNGQPASGTWHHAIAEPLRVEDPELGEWYEALGEKQQREHDALVEARCEQLNGAVGDLTAFPVISQNRAIVDLAPHVVLSTQPDLVVLGRGRVIVEVKSGKGYGIESELSFYALVEALCEGTAPSLAVGVSLVPSTVLHSLAIDVDLLYQTANRVVQTARRCRVVDESTVAKRWPSTSPGRHCVICDLAEQCPDVPEEYLNEAQFSTGKGLEDDFDNDEEESW